MSPYLKEPNRNLRFLISIACVLAVIWTLRTADDFLIPVVVAFFLTQLSLPIVKCLRKRKVPVSLAVLLTVLVNILVVTVVVLFFVGVISKFQQVVLERGYIEDLVKRASQFGVWLEEKVEVEGTGKSFQELLYPQVDALVRFIRIDVVGRITSLFSTTFFIIILMVFMLVESLSANDRLAAIREARGPNLFDLQSVSNDIQRYLGIKTAVSAVTGVLAWLSTRALGIEFPELWGVIAFALNYIPAIGSIMAAVPPILVAMVQFGVWKSGEVLACYLAINIVLGNFIEPMLLGRRFGISTLVVILSVLFWGWVWGLVGMFLAIPLSMLVKVIFDNTVEFRWLSVAMGKGRAVREVIEAAAVEPEAAPPDPLPPPAKTSEG